MTTPALTKVSTKTRRDNYRIASFDLNSVNTVLTQIGLRLDQIDAIGQNPDIKGRRLVNVAPAVEPSDAIRFDQLTLDVFTTDDLPEGLTNLYFTDERVDDRIAVLFIAGTAIELSYDDIANTFSVAVKIKADNGITSDANGLYVMIKADNGISVDAAGIFVKTKDDTGIKVDSGGIYIQIKGDNGIDVGADGIFVKIKADNGIAVDTNGIFAKIKADNGIGVDSNGLYVSRKTGYGIDVDSDGLKLKQQAHEADASASHSITDPADSPADADALRDDLVTNTIPAIESALNALGTKINNILSKLETAEVLASS